MGGGIAPRAFIGFSLCVGVSCSGKVISDLGADGGAATGGAGTGGAASGGSDSRATGGKISSGTTFGSGGKISGGTGGADYSDSGRRPMPDAATPGNPDGGRDCNRTDAGCNPP